MYRPNFCAECGERVVRVRTRPWTSRRFCTPCARRFRRGRWLKPLGLAALLVGCGFAAGRLWRPTPAPLLDAPGASASAPVPAVGRPPQTVAPDKRNGSRSEGAPQSESGGPSGERPTDPAELVSICGARTKKGTPCQRRVRGTGRCWQHRGKPAALPPEKLVVPH